MKVIGHRQHERCPRCKADRYCDDCGICSKCTFAAPLVKLLPPGTQCPECKQSGSHTRVCSVTIRRAGN